MSVFYFMGSFGYGGLSKKSCLVERDILPMEYKTITAVGIDVSKGKSTIAVRRPGGEVVLVPFQVNHDAAGLSGLVKTLRGIEGLRGRYFTGRIFCCLPQMVL